MKYNSILYINSETGLDTENTDASYFIDLNLDQICNSIITTDYEEFDLKPLFYTPLKELDTIYYRQEIMRELENKDIFKTIYLFSSNMRIIHRYLNLTKNLYYKYHKEGWFLEAIVLYCDIVKDFVKSIGEFEIKSRGLNAFRRYITTYSETKDFIQLLTKAKTLREKLNSIKYSLIIKNNSVKVRKYESEIDYSNIVEKTFKKFQQGAVKDYKVKFFKVTGMNHVEAGILNFVAKLFPKVFSELDSFILNNSDFLNVEINTFSREIQFYISYLKYIEKLKKSGLKFCYPKMSESSKDISGYCVFDLALATKLLSTGKQIVSNDFYLKGKERVIVVSGPNQGGKTTFARTVGQLHYLSRLGYPVPGTSANLFLFDKLYTHFERGEKIENLRGKLQDDLFRIHNILRGISPSSIIIMNEIFNSTTLQDATLLSKEIMKKIINKDLLCIWVTFIEELSNFGEETVSMVSILDPNIAEKRTYKVKRKTADGLSYAISIAKKYNLTYDEIMERLVL